MARNPFKLEDHYDESFALEDDDEEEDDSESLLQDNPVPSAPTQRPASARHGGRGGRPVSGRFRPAAPQKTGYEDSENDESSELESTDDEFDIKNFKNENNNRPSNPQISSQNIHNSPENNLNPSSEENNSSNEDSGSPNSEDDDDSDDDSENLYNPDQFKNLPVSKEIKDLFSQINKYKPKKTPLLQKLRPFIPEYVPAVGDIDAFLKIPRPDGKDQDFGLGWQVLDEPSLKQTDPAILDQTLKTLGNQENNSNQMNFVHSVENAEKNSKRVESWIDEITELNRSKPAQTVTFNKPMPDVESIMSAWPEKTESVLRTPQIIPSAEELDCSLEQYAKMVCSMFDIPVYEGSNKNQIIQSLHVLFSTYTQFKQLDFNQDEVSNNDDLLATSKSDLGSKRSNNNNTNNNSNSRSINKRSDVMTFN